MGGIVQDLLSVAPIGASALGLILIVFIVSLLSRGLFRVGPILLSALVVTGTVLHQSVFAFILAATGMPSSYLTTFTYVIVPSAIYNLAAVAFVYFFVRQAQKRLRPNKQAFS